MSTDQKRAKRGRVYARARVQEWPSMRNFMHALGLRLARRCRGTFRSVISHSAISCAVPRRYRSHPRHGSLPHAQLVHALNVLGRPPTQRARAPARLRLWSLTPLPRSCPTSRVPLFDFHRTTSAIPSWAFLNEVIIERVEILRYARIGVVSWAERHVSTFAHEFLLTFATTRQL